jgi:hypothetical protein
MCGLGQTRFDHYSDTHSIEMHTAEHVDIQAVLFIIGCFISTRKWQVTHALRDKEMLSECAVCFEVFDAAPAPCRHCGSKVSSCEKCLQAWSSASHAVRSCVVCRVADGKVPRRPMQIDLMLDRERPFLTTGLLISAVLLYYWWVFIVFALRSRIS